MCLALEEARLAEKCGEVPIGAVVIDPETGRIVATGRNKTIADSDPTAHAEIVAIRAACREAGAQRIPGYDLYVTLEPCAMCAAAISFARLRRVVFAAVDAKGGGVLHGGKFFEQPTCHHHPQISSGTMAAESAELLQNFFRARR